MRGESGRVAARVRELLNGYAVESDQAPAAPPGPPQVTWWQRLVSRLPVRVDPGGRAALGVGLAVVAAALITGLWVLAQRPRVVPVSAGAPRLPGAASPVGTAAAAAGAPPPSSPATTASVVVVDVAGKVRHPGLYRLPEGSRVDDAVRAAGGARAKVDLTSLNLAARLVDGQQIVVGSAGSAGNVPVGSGGAAGGPGTGAPSGPVNLNTATLEQLDGLPGVGPVTAQHILDWRTAHGNFSSIDQLNDVSGIGDVKFAELQGFVTV